MELFNVEYGLVFWMFVAFLCLYFLLSKFAWPFIIKAVEDRADLIDKGVAYAQEAKTQLDNAKAEADKLIAEARSQQADILRDATKMRNQIVSDARGEATVEARKVAEAAQLSIEQARKESQKQLKREVSEIALQIAEKVLRSRISDDKAQQELVEKYLNEVETKN